MQMAKYGQNNLGVERRHNSGKGEKQEKESKRDEGQRRAACLLETGAMRHTFCPFTRRISISTSRICSSRESCLCLYAGAVPDLRLDVLTVLPSSPPAVDRFFLGAAREFPAGFQGAVCRSPESR